MKTASIKDYLHLHLLVIIWGFTGILGKLISLPAESLVFYRMILSLPTLFLVITFKKTPLKIPLTLIFTYLLIGIILGMHWITFFGSIKLSNVSIALSCFASTTIFASLLEPLFFRRKISFFDIAVGLMVFLTLSYMFHTEIDYIEGALVAVLSAFLNALFLVLNKKSTFSQSSLTISFYEFVGALIPVVLFLYINTDTLSTFLFPTKSDWFWLFLLALGCTVYPFTALVSLVKKLSAFSISLTVNFEPVYSVILAFFIFGESEKMTLPFYIGLFIIFTLVLGYPMVKNKKSKKN
jgi:drug/metabolite transporter (DMT)-like permease